MKELPQRAAYGVCIGLVAASLSGAARADDVTEAGRLALRARDCARCHGKHYDGLIGPSLLRYVGAYSAEQFSRDVLTGNPPRGMPGYAAVPLAVERADAMYVYLKARAQTR